MELEIVKKLVELEIVTPSYLLSYYSGAKEREPESGAIPNQLEILNRYTLYIRECRQNKLIVGANS